MGGCNTGTLPGGDVSGREPIETERLRLVPFAPCQILALIEAPESFESLLGFPAAAGLREFFLSDDVSQAFLASLRILRHPDPWHLGFAVLHGDDRKVIGSAGFNGAPDSAGLVEVAYGIVPDFQGRGYATEANTALVAFAFGSGLVRTIRANTLPVANASTKVLRKCHFIYKGEFDDPDDGLVWRWERTATDTGAH
ncbi:MAG: GNAT family N-acetyltransferase [Gemmatimonadota bacterium]|nr:GNAT family N-acetyltransferase [Gemmatimonadota bacterium]